MRGSVCNTDSVYKNIVKKFLHNTTLSFMGKAVGMLSLVLLDIVIARRLSVDGYAEWVYFFSVLTMLFFVGWLGINASAKVAVSHCMTKTDKECCLTGAMILRICGSGIISMILTALLLALSGRLGYPDKYPNLKALILYAGFLIFFNSFTEFYKEILMGLERFGMLFFITVLEYVGYLVFACLLLFKNTSVICVARAYCFSGLTVFAAGFIFLRREYSLFRQSLFQTERIPAFIREVAAYAVPLLLVGMGLVILIEIDTFMLGVLSSKDEVAMYNIGKSLNSKAAHINYSIAVGAMTPFAIIDRASHGEKRKQFNKISAVNGFATILIALALFFLAPVMIRLLYGEEYTTAGSVTRMLVPYYLLYSLSTFYSTFLDFRGMAKARSLSYIGIIALDIVLNYVLIPQWGADGAALATSISLLPYTVTVIILSEREWKKL